MACQAVLCHGNVWKFTAANGDYFFVELCDDVLEKFRQKTAQDEDILEVLAVLQEANATAHNNVKGVIAPYVMVVTAVQSAENTPTGPPPKKRAVSVTPLSGSAPNTPVADTPRHDLASALADQVSALSPFGKAKKGLYEAKQATKQRPHTKWEKVVRVESFPPLSSEEEITNFFNEAAKEYGVLAPGDTEVVARVYDLEAEVCHVEFHNEHYARRLCECEPLVMGESQLNLQQMKVVSMITLNFIREREVKTEFVRVENLPLNFVEGHFLQNFLKMQMKCVDAVRVSDYEKDQRSCRVEFTDAEAASKLCKMKLSAYDRCKLRCDQEVQVKKHELQSTVLVSDLPELLNLSHLELFLNETGELYRLTDSKAVKSISYEKGNNMCRVEDPYVAEQIAGIKPFVYDGALLTLQQLYCVPSTEEEEAGQETPLIRFGHLPDDFHKFQRSFLVTLSEVAVQNHVCDADEGNIKCVKEYSVQKGECIVECANSAIAKKFVDAVPSVDFRGKVLTLVHVVDEPLASTLPPEENMNSSKILRIEDVITKAAVKPGRKGAKFNWDHFSTATFLDVYLAYCNSKGSMAEKQWEEVGAHLWFKFSMDVPVSQLKEKMKGLKNYFNGTVMKSASGKDGTSSYAHYTQMLQIQQQYKVSIPNCSKRISTETSSRDSPVKKGPVSGSSDNDGPPFKEIRASMDNWDLNAVILLLTEYQMRQALFNSVSGTDRIIELYKLVAIGMSNAEPGRFFTPEECKARAESLFQTFLAAKDLMSSQTGAGAIPMKRPIWNLLSEIHNGSVAVEAPYSFSVGACHKVRRGEVAREKVVGRGGKATRKTWDWRKDQPLTSKQQQQSLEASKLEVSKNMLEELRFIRKAREAREGRYSNDSESQ